MRERLMAVSVPYVKIYWVLEVFPSGSFYKFLLLHHQRSFSNITCLSPRLVSGTITDVHSMKFNICNNWIDLAQDRDQ
jgi:hypothetical protein